VDARVIEGEGLDAKCKVQVTGNASRGASVIK